MSLKFIYFYLLFQGIKLLRVSLEISFFFGFVLISFDEFIFIRSINSLPIFCYLGPYGFNLLLLILGHSVLCIGLFNKLNKMFYYLLFVLLLFIFNFVIYKFFGYMEASPGLANFCFYFFDLFVFWILELGLFPIAWTFIKSNHD